MGNNYPVDHKKSHKYQEFKPMLPIYRSVASFKVLLVLGLLLAWCVSIYAASAVDPMTDSTLVLPAGSGIAWRWVVPPVSLDKPLPRHTLNDIRFSVDSSGNPWIGIENRQLLNPVKQVSAVLSEPFQRFVHLDNGLLLFSTVRTLGYIGVAGKEEFDGKGNPIMPYQPICDLPAYYSRIYRASGNCAYLVAEDAAARKSSVYLLRPEATAPGARTEVKNFRKVFETGETITAVAGDETTAFIALGKLVMMLTLEDSKLTAIPAQPDEEVKELAYGKGVGLFYAGGSGVGFLGAKRAFRFIETSNARIGLHGTNLLVLFPRHLGVLSFDNINRLWNFDFVLADN